MQLNQQTLTHFRREIEKWQFKNLKEKLADLYMLNFAFKNFFCSLSSKINYEIIYLWAINFSRDFSSYDFYARIKRRTHQLELIKTQEQHVSKDLHFIVQSSWLHRAYAWLGIRRHKMYF